jgi:hypothetical protein
MPHIEIATRIRDAGMISTKDLTQLPAPMRLRELFRSLAMLDAILEPRISQRSFFFLSHWSIVDSIGTIRLGDNHLFAAFGNQGAFLKGFGKDSIMGEGGKNWPGIDRGVPRVFAEWIIHPYFEFEHTTFCVYRLANDSTWCRSDFEPPLGDDPDGSAALLRFLDGDPATYTAFAEARQGAAIDIDAVGYIFDQGYITESILRVLSPQITYRSLAHDLRVTGYPLREPL